MINLLKLHISINFNIGKSMTVKSIITFDISAFAPKHLMPEKFSTI